MGENIDFWTELDEKMEPEESDIETFELKKPDFLSKKLQKVSLDYESFEKQLTNIIESFGNLMKTNSKYSIEGIQINIGVTAQGNIIIAGGSMSGGMTITIKPKNNEEK